MFNLMDSTLIICEKNVSIVPALLCGSIWVRAAQPDETMLSKLVSHLMTKMLL